eukprot:UN24497
MMFCDCNGHNFMPIFFLLNDALLQLYENGVSTHRILIQYYRLLMFWAGINKLNSKFPGQMNVLYLWLIPNAYYWHLPKAIEFLAACGEISIAVFLVNRDTLTH